MPLPTTLTRINLAPASRRMLRSQRPERHPHLLQRHSFDMSDREPIVQVLVARHGGSVCAEQHAIPDSPAGLAFWGRHVHDGGEGDGAGAIGWAVDRGPAALHDPGIEEWFHFR